MVYLPKTYWYDKPKIIPWADLITIFTLATQLRALLQMDYYQKGRKGTLIDPFNSQVIENRPQEDKISSENASFKTLIRTNKRGVIRGSITPIWTQKWYFLWTLKRDHKETIICVFCCCVTFQLTLNELCLRKECHLYLPLPVKKVVICSGQTNKK